ncbi:MAG: hypothetical protein AB1635_02150 [Acidobacteriota bacterium]
MVPAPRWLTLAELAALAGRLERRPCSERQARYLLVACALGTELPRRPHGQTRLYGPLDLALLRLAVRLRREGASAWLARVVLTYLRNDLVRAFRAAAPVALAVRGVQASLEPALKQRPGWAAYWVPLRDVWAGLDAEIDRVVAGRDEIWMYKPVPVRAVPRGTA